MQSGCVMEQKKIQTLRLSSCYNGDISRDDNVARAFMSWDTIEEIYAWDGESCYWVSGNKVYKISTITINSETYELYFDLQFMIETPEEYSDFLYSLLISAFSFENPEWPSFDNVNTGLVRYYKNSLGEIVYEDVTDSNIYFGFYLCS